MRLIDADKLLEGIAELKQSPWYNSKYGYADRKEAVETIEDLCIKREPTIDAIEVVKSKWVEAEDIGDCCYTCLNCGFIRDTYLLDTANYCPNCGAKMEEEEWQKR